MAHKTNYVLTAVVASVFVVLGSWGFADATSTFITQQGGTGTSSPSGILYGDNGATSHLNTTKIGSGLTFSGGTLSATGGGGSGTVSTSSSETAGQVPFWTSTNGTPALLSGGNANFVWDNTNSRLGIGTSSPSFPFSLGTAAAPLTAWFATSNTHLGTSTCPESNAAYGGVGVEICGDDNSDGGVNLIVGNRNAGGAAFGSVTFGNDASIGNTTNYGVLNLNSYLHTNIDFGGIPAIGGSLSLYSSETSLWLGTSTTSPLGYTGIFAGGANLNNEVGRFTTSGLGLGTLGGNLTSKLTVNGDYGDTNSSIFTVASSTQTSTTTVAQFLNSGRINLFGAATSTIPVLQISEASASSTNSTITAGVVIQGTAAGFNQGTASGSVNITAASTQANENLLVQSKGTGNLILGAGSGGAGVIDMQINNSNRYVLTNTTNTWSPSSSNTAANVRFQVTNAADAVLTAGAEAPWVYFIGNNNTRTHATGTVIPLQRDFRISGTNHAFNGFNLANNVFTDMAAFSVDYPQVGTNARATNIHAIYIPTLALNASTTNAYGLTVNATTGATNNYAAQFLGGAVGIASSTPGALLAVHAKDQTNNINLFMVGSSTATASTSLYTIDNVGHHYFGGATPVISSCGTTPSGTVVGNDNAGTISVGGGVVTACTATFANAWKTAPVCTTADNSTAITGDISAISATAFTVSFSASLGGGAVYYQCVGTQ